MKSDDYLVQCPYYVRDKEHTLSCEGFHGGMQIRMVFHSGNSKRVYKQRFCRNQWANCPWAQTQNRRYGYTPPESAGPYRLSDEKIREENARERTLEN